MKTITKLIYSTLAGVSLAIGPLTANANPGDIFVSDLAPPNNDGVIYKFTPDGTQSIFATGLEHPSGLALDSAGYLFAADFSFEFAAETIYKFAPDGTRSTFASNVVFQNNDPLVLAFDSGGNLFMSNDEGHTIYKFAPDGTRSTFAYDPAMFPAGLAFDSDDNLFVGEDSGAGTIYKFTPNGTRSIFATGFGRYFGPLALVFDSAGFLFVSDTSQGIIYKFAPDGTYSTISVFLIEQPYATAFDSAGYLFTAGLSGFGYNYGNIYKFAPDGTWSHFATLGEPGLGHKPTYIAIEPGGPIFTPTPTPTATATPTPTATLTPCPLAAPNAQNATNVTLNSFTAHWSSVSGAIDYRLDVSTSNSFTTYVPGYQDLSVGNMTSFNVTGLSANTTYFYRVRAYNGCATSTNSNVKNAKTLPCTPAAPNAQNATNVSFTSFTAHWSSVSGATGYRLDVSTTNTFATYVPGFQNLSVGNTTSYSVTGLSPNTTYYYRVRAYNGCATSPNSNVKNVQTTACAPNAPSAQNATSVTASSFTANWSSVSGATDYRLDVSTSNTFTTYVSGYQDLSVGNVTTYNVTGLSANTTYYYRVRAYNGCATSPNSNVKNVKTKR